MMKRPTLEVVTSTSSSSSDFAASSAWSRSLFSVLEAIFPSFIALLIISTPALFEPPIRNCATHYIPQHNRQITKCGSLCRLRPCSGLRVNPDYPGFREPSAVKMVSNQHQHMVIVMAKWCPGQPFPEVTVTKNISPPQRAKMAAAWRTLSTICVPRPTPSPHQ